MGKLLIMFVIFSYLEFTEIWENKLWCVSENRKHKRILLKFINHLRALGMTKISAYVDIFG